MSRHEDVSDMVAESEQQGLAFLHQARKVRDLDSDQVERIAGRLHRPAARPRHGLWPALAVVALLMVAGAALAVARDGLRALPILGPLLSPAPAPASKTMESHRGRGVAPRSLPDEPEPAAGPVTQPGQKTADAGGQPRALAPREPSHSTARAPERVLAHGADVPSRGATADDAIVPESRSFATVIESWHHQHDAGIALALLDAHQRRYPAGHMRLEAGVLRAELYLAQGQNALALSVLDGMSLSGIPRARELQTLRGELRVKAGRCREARSDLGGVLETNTADGLAKRATHALAHCP